MRGRHHRNPHLGAAVRPAHLHFRPPPPSAGDADLRVSASRVRLRRATLQTHRNYRRPSFPPTKDPYERLRFALQIRKAARHNRSRVLTSDLVRGLRRHGRLAKLRRLSGPSSAKEAPYHAWSDPAHCAVLVSREEAITAEAELAAAEAERHVWRLEQVLGWIAYRRDRTFRSLGRIDLQPPTFFGQSYRSDRVESQPLATLTSKLLSGEVNAYVQGTALTRAECISLLSEKDGLWSNQDLVFLPGEVRAIWQRKAEISPKIAGREKAQALAELTEILKEGKRRKIRVLHDDAKRWMKEEYKIEGKAFSKIWREARGHPDVRAGCRGRSTEAQRKASASLFEILPENPSEKPAEIKPYRY